MAAPLLLKTEEREGTYWDVALGNDPARTRHVRRAVRVRRALRPGVGEIMLLLLLSVAAGAYLLYAMLRPERFW